MQRPEGAAIEDDGVLGFQQPVQPRVQPGQHGERQHQPRPDRPAQPSAGGRAASPGREVPRPYGQRDRTRQVERIRDLAGDEALFTIRAEHRAADRHDDGRVEQKPALPEEQGPEQKPAPRQRHVRKSHAMLLHSNRGRGPGVSTPREARRPSIPGEPDHDGPHRPRPAIRRVPEARPRRAPRHLKAHDRLGVLSGGEGAGESASSPVRTQVSEGIREASHVCEETAPGVCQLAD